MGQNLASHPERLGATGDGALRLTRLDGLRGLTALGVLLYHMLLADQVHHAGLGVEAGWPLGWLADDGWMLVDLFYVLSGYVLAHVYCGGERFSRPGAMADFWGARVARLWPLHLTTLALVALFAWGGQNDLRHLLLHLAMLQGIDLDAMRSFNAVSWSLTIELIAYAAFAWGAWRGERCLRWVTGLAVAGSIWWMVLTGHPQGGPWFQDLIPRGLLGFFSGHLLWRWRVWLGRLPWGLLALPLLGGFWLEHGPYNPLLPLGLLSWPAAVLLALRIPLFGSRAMSWLGDRSFGLYMVHMLVLRAMERLWPPQGSGWDLAANHLAVLLLALLGAELSCRLVERPGRDLLRTAWSMMRGMRSPAFSSQAPSVR